MGESRSMQQLDVEQRPRLGRLRTSSEEAQFALGLGTGWFPYGELGLDAATTADAIEGWPVARRRVLTMDDRERAQQVRHVGESELACPVAAPTKILVTGMNYDTHNDEMKRLAPVLTGRYVELTGDRPERPLLFSKHPSALIGTGEHIEVNTSLVSSCDYEVELAVVVGAKVKNLTLDTAWSAVFGYTIANDVSARDWVLTESQFMRGKSFDTFCPVGPWITTGLSPSAVEGLTLESRVNGEPRQRAQVREMTFSIPEILVHASAATTLHPGDLVLTGTPPGVGFGMTPQTFLGQGDVVECRISDLGRLINTVTTVAEPAGLAS